MLERTAPVLRDIVLVGGGHSHAVALRRFGMRPVPGVRLTVVCRDTHTPYSGMLPGYVAGHYGFDDIHIDLRRLTQFAGGRFVRAEVVGLDRANRKVLVHGRPPLAYDVLSLNVGSTPRLDATDGAAGRVVPVKPIHDFNARWLALLERARGRRGPLRLAVVGAGAGGVELLLAMQYRLANELGAARGAPDGLEFHLFEAGARILPTHAARVRAAFERVLAARKVVLHPDSAVARVEPGRLITDRGEAPAFDEIVWVTGARGPPWLAATGLALDPDGFVQVEDTLRSVSDPLVFAAGDVARMVRHPREKAGVFAVRQGRPLADNLRRLVEGRPLRPYRPQARWLALISTGDRHAVASRGAIGFGGDWVWRWKDWIDRRFMRRFAELEPMADAPRSSERPHVRLDAEESAQAISALAMRCGGCGAKVGTDVLSRALAPLRPVGRADVVIGLDAPDDAAVVRVPAGKALVQTVDFFRAFIDDPYVFGKVAANHALGDVFAMGGEPQTAMAIATLPPGLEAKTEELLFQLMSGAVEVLDAAGCALVGGHTGEGAELALGFAVNGLVDADLAGVLRKGGMRPADALILTKPIGTGTLFAAHPRLRARGRWIDAALDSMLVSNRAGARCLIAHGATACTDLTGFGLLGHLVEMIRPSGVDVELHLGALPVLEGAEETANAGILSSLQPANARLRRALRNQAEMVSHPRYRLLFDPQTAGGLLASVPEAQVQACLRALHACGYPHACVIGRVAAAAQALEPIVLKA